MISTEERREFLHVFYRLTNQQAPNNLVDVDTLGRECGFGADTGEEVARVLADDGYLEPKGPFPDYRLTPKGWLEVREAMRAPGAESHLTPRLTVQVSTLGEPASPAATVAEQQIGSQDREVVRSMLNLVNKRLDALESSGKWPIAPLRDIIRDVEAELQQAEPHVLRLRGLLLGLALACQIPGDEEHMDHDVKVALSFLGIDLL
jgi:hypothetical protein